MLAATSTPLLHQSALLNRRRALTLPSLLVALLLSLPSSLSAELAWTRVAIRPLAESGIPQEPTYDAAYPSQSGGFNVALTYEIGSEDFLFLLSSASGQAGIFRLDATGGAPTLIQAPQFRPGLRAAATYREGGPRQLVLLDPIGGALYVYAVDSNGLTAPGPSAPVAERAALTRVNLFSSFSLTGDRLLLGLDTWSGLAATFDTDGWDKIDNRTWTLGWTDVDHMRVDDRTYRLLYKELGQPFDPDSGAGPQGGRLSVSEVGTDGFALDQVYDGNDEPGWTTVRFVRYAGKRGMLFYRRGDGRFLVRPFAEAHPDASDFDVPRKSTQIEAGFDQVLTYRVGSQAFVVGTTINTENEDRLDAVQMARLAQCVHDNVEAGVVGYQLSIMQSGEVLLDRAWGKKKLSPSMDMETSTRIAVGSVSKMFTTITGLRASEEDVIDLVQPIAGQLDAAKYPPASLADWVTLRTPLELMAQVTGVNGGQCSGANDLSLDCSAYFGKEADAGWCDENLPDDRFPCRRKYNNANFSALRTVLESQTGLETTPEIDALTRDLWLREIFPVKGPSCLAQPGSFEHAPCASGDTCFPWNGRSWVQAAPGKRIDGWSKSCAAGGWTASARQLTEMLQALRYGQILSAKNTERMLSVDFLDMNGNATALGWEPPWTVGGEKQLGKNGSPTRRIGTVSYITRLPDEADGALLYNTKGGGAKSPTGLLRAAYKYAVGLDTCP